MHRWAIEIFRRDGTRVGQNIVEPDLAPLIECARLSFLRRHGPSAAADYDRPVQIEPAWSGSLQEPYVGGMRMTIGGEPVEELTGTSMFKTTAIELSGKFVNSGELEADSTFLYLVTAYPDDTEPRPSSSTRFCVSSIPVSLAVSSGFWPPGARREESAEVGVVLPQRLLEEITELTVASRGVETGGVLLGHLRWDPELADLFIETTEQIHARSAIGDEKRLQFTADCWAEIHSTMAIRRRGESIVGWWHSHPAREWCRDCPRERQQDCSLQSGFLSEHDKTLHRTVFPRAFTTALVATDSALGEVRFAMFGWKGGVLKKRGYQVIGSDPVLVGKEGGESCEHPKSIS